MYGSRKSTCFYMYQHNSIKVVGTAGTQTGPYAPLIGMAVGKAVGDKLDKMDVQRNSRNRKIKFFLDKMKAVGGQQDSFAKIMNSYTGCDKQPWNCSYLTLKYCV